MNTLKKIVTLVLLQLIINNAIAQNKNTELNTSSEYTVSIEIDKSEYSLTENIYIRFKINFIDDSLQASKFEGFEILNSSISYNMRGAEQTKTMSYVLKPINSGEYIIESPIFFKNGEEIKGREKIIVFKALLSAKRQKEIEKEFEFKMFVASNFKPNGTYRYVIGDEFGYIEILKDTQWEFFRKLTPKEFKLIKKMK